MGDHSAFFYGTLMAKEVLYRVCYGPGKVGTDPAATTLAKNLTIQAAILHEFCRHRVQNADYPGIIPEQGQTVRGTYVTGLTDGDIYRLDTFEGEEYTRSKVEVAVLKDGKVEGGEMKKTETYIFTAGDNYLEKKEWDYDEFRKDKLHRWTGESYEFQVDEAVAALNDPTGGRSTFRHEDSQWKEEILENAV